MVRQDVNSYNIIMAVNWKSDVKPDESILGKAYNGYIFGIFLLLLLLLVLPRCLDM